MKYGKGDIILSPRNKRYHYLVLDTRNPASYVALCLETGKSVNIAPHLPFTKVA